MVYLAINHHRATVWWGYLARYSARHRWFDDRALVARPRTAARDLSSDGKYFALLRLHLVFARLPVWRDYDGAPH